jgi:hypothetical protein
MDQTLLLVAIGLLLLILLGRWTDFYQLIKQQGRLLLRLDNIEQHRESRRVRLVASAVEEECS